MSRRVSIPRAGLAFAPLLWIALYAVDGRVDAAPPVPSCVPTAVTTLPTVGTPTVTAIGAPTTVAAAVAPATVTATAAPAAATKPTLATTVSATGVPASVAMPVPSTNPPPTTLLPGWVPFVSTGGDFVAAFPEQPETQTVNAPTADGGTILIVVHGVEVADGRAYLVSDGTIPAGGSFSLEGGRDGMVASSGGTMTCSNLIELQGRPGIETHATVSNGSLQGTLIGRIYSSGDRFYQVTVVGPGSFDATDPDVVVFLGAFQFVNGAAT